MYRTIEASPSLRLRLRASRSNGLGAKQRQEGGDDTVIAAPQLSARTSAHACGNCLHALPGASGRASGQEARPADAHTPHEWRGLFERSNRGGGAGCHARRMARLGSTGASMDHPGSPLQASDNTPERRAVGSPAPSAELAHSSGGVGLSVPLQRHPLPRGISVPGRTDSPLADIWCVSYIFKTQIAP